MSTPSSVSLRTRRLVAHGVAIACGLAIALSAAAQPVRTPREAAPIDEAVWTQLRDSMILGCRFSPPEPPAGSAAAPATIERACACMARRFADRARASEPFRTALRADDRTAIAQLARTFVIEPDGRRSYAACAQDETTLSAWVSRLFGRP
jgi:hypothetical protein